MAGLLLMAGLSPLAATPTVPPPDQKALTREAQQAGASDLKVSRRSDGGLLLNGKLEGRQFALAIPARWNRQAVLFAHGYSAHGSSVNVPDDPLTQDLGGIQHTPYAQGFAVGHSAYAKAGMGVETGTLSTYRLKQFVDRLGATRVYVSGTSMGSNIVLALIERYPRDFAGALATCGVVGDWPSLIGHLIDMRATYNYFARDTAYALPGQQSIASNAFPTTSPPSSDNLAKLRAPVLALFKDARADPQGKAAGIVRNVAAITGAEEDAGTFLNSLVTVSIGVDDFNATFGGSIYDNHAKVYVSPRLFAAENAALNKGIERIGAGPAAVAHAAEWYKPTSKIETKLLTFYNTIDAPVPSNLEEPMF